MFTDLRFYRPIEFKRVIFKCYLSREIEINLCFYCSCAPRVWPRITWHAFFVFRESRGLLSPPRDIQSNVCHTLLEKMELLGGRKDINIGENSCWAEMAGCHSGTIPLLRSFPLPVGEYIYICTQRLQHIDFIRASHTCTYVRFLTLKNSCFAVY